MSRTKTNRETVTHNCILIEPPGLNYKSEYGGG